MTENEPDNGSGVLCLQPVWREPKKPAAEARSDLPEQLLARVKEELTCCLCLDLAARPATLPCGHSACRGCLTELFSIGRPDAQRRCPACRAPLPLGLPPLQLNATLKCLAELLLPEECKERSRVPSPPPPASRPTLRQRVLLHSAAGRRSVSMHTASDLTAAGMRAAHAGLRAMLDVLEDRWPELEEEGAQEQQLPAETIPARSAASPAQQRTPNARAIPQRTPGPGRLEQAQRVAAQQAQRSPAAASPTPIRWRSARALEVRPSPTWRGAQGTASPSPGPAPAPAAAAFGSPAEANQAASAQPAPEAAVPTEPAAEDTVAAPPPAVEQPTWQRPAAVPPVDGDTGGAASPASGATGGAAEQQQGSGTPEAPAHSPAPAAAAAGQAVRGRLAGRRVHVARHAMAADATATVPASSSTAGGRRSLSAPGVARNRDGLPRWQR
ncbi:hypothetical protein ABPG75_005658 [Micractinium tetrahymenae]